MPGTMVDDTVNRICESLSASKLKLTDKRTYLQRLQDELHKQSVCTALDSVKGDDEGFTWTKIVHLLLRLTREEFETMLKGYAKHERCGTSSNAKQLTFQKLDVFQCLQSVLGAALAGSFRISLVDTAEFVCQVLQSDLKTVYLVGVNSLVVQVLMKDSSTASQLSDTEWKILLYEYVEMVKVFAAASHWTQTCEAFKFLISHAVHYVPSMNIIQMLRSLEPCFENLRAVRSLAAANHLTAIINCLFDRAKNDSRFALCTFGAKMPQYLLAYVDLAHAHDALQLEIARFLNTLLILHHPCSASDVAIGAEISDAWLNTLQSIYECVYGGFARCARCSTMPTQLFVAPPVVTELMCRLMVQGNRWADSWDLSTLGSIFDVFPASLGPSVNKRPRMEIIGWRPLLDYLCSLGSKPEVVPWLQVFKHFLLEFAPWYLCDEYKFLVSSLVAMMQSLKNVDVLKCVLQTLIAALRSMWSVTLSAEMWQQVWEGTMRVFVLKPSQPTACQLLTVVLQHSRGLFADKAQADLSCLFASIVLDVNAEVCYLLGALLAECNIFDGGCLKALQFEHFPARCSRFRCCVATWLLSSLEAKCDDPSAQTLLDICRMCGPVGIGDCLVKLSLREVSKCSVTNTSTASNLLTIDADTWPVTELLYLETLFLPLLPEHSISLHDAKVVGGRQMPLLRLPLTEPLFLDHVAQFIVERLHSIVDNLLKTYLHAITENKLRIGCLVHYHSILAYLAHSFAAHCHGFEVLIVDLEALGQALLNYCIATGNAKLSLAYIVTALHDLVCSLLANNIPLVPDYWSPGLLSLLQKEITGTVTLSMLLVIQGVNAMKFVKTIQTNKSRTKSASQEFDELFNEVPRVKGVCVQDPLDADQAVRVQAWHVILLMNACSNGATVAKSLVDATMAWLEEGLEAKGSSFSSSALGAQLVLSAFEERYLAVFEVEQLEQLLRCVRHLLNRNAKQQPFCVMVLERLRLVPRCCRSFAEDVILGPYLKILAVLQRMERETIRWVHAVKRSILLCLCEIIEKVNDNVPTLWSELLSLCAGAKAWGVSTAVRQLARLQLSNEDMAAVAKVVLASMELVKSDEDRAQLGRCLLRLVCVCLKSSAQRMTGMRILLDTFAALQNQSTEHGVLAIAHRMLETVGVALRCSAQHLMRELLEFAFNHWFEQHRSLETFPASLFGANCVENFLTTYFRSVAPILLAYRRQDLIDSTAAALRLTVPQLFEACLPILCAVLLPPFLTHDKCANGDGLRTAWESVRSVLGMKQVAVNFQLDASLAQVVGEVLCRGSIASQEDGDARPLGQLSDTAIVAVLQWIAQLLGKTDFVTALAQQSQAFLDVLLILRGNLFRSLNTSRIAHGYWLLLDALSSSKQLLQLELGDALEFVKREIFSALAQRLRLTLQQGEECATVVVLVVALHVFFVKFGQVGDMTDMQVQAVVLCAEALRFFQERTFAQTTEVEVLLACLMDGERACHWKVPLLPSDVRACATAAARQRARHDGDFPLEQEHLRWFLTSHELEFLANYALQRDVWDLQQNLVDSLGWSLWPLACDRDSKHCSAAARLLGWLQPRLPVKAVFEISCQKKIASLEEIVLEDLEKALFDPDIDVARCARNCANVLLARSEWQKQVVDECSPFRWLLPFIVADKSALPKPTASSHKRLMTDPWRKECWQDYGQWLVAVYHWLLDTYGTVIGAHFYTLLPLCLVKTTIIETLLPCGVQSVCAAKVPVDILVAGMNQLFEAAVELLRMKSSSRSAQSPVVQICLCCLHVLRHLRTRTTLPGWSAIIALTGMRWHVVSEACVLLQLPHEALYCSEVALNCVRTTDIDYAAFSGDVQQQAICRNVADACVLAEPQLAMLDMVNARAYLHLGDGDALHGLNCDAQADPNVRLYLAAAENDWLKVLTMHSSLTAADFIGCPDIARKVADCYSLDTEQHLVETASTEFRERQYRAAWQLADWTNIELPTCEAVPSFDACLVAVMKCLSRSATRANDDVECILRIVRQRCGAILNDAFHNDDQFPSCFAQLGACNDVEALFLGKTEHTATVWQTECKAIDDLRLRVRSSCLQAMNKSLSSQVIEGATMALYSQQAERARQEKLFKLSLNIVDRLSNLLDAAPPNLLVAEHCKFESARIFWHSGDRQMALFRIKEMISRLEQQQRQHLFGEPDIVLLAKCRMLCGQFQEGMSFGTALQTSQQCYNMAAVSLEELMQKRTCSREAQLQLADASLTLARFADRQYEGLSEYLTSWTFQSKLAVEQKMRSDIHSIRSSPALSSMKQASRFQVLLNHRSNLDADEKRTAMQQREEFLKAAVLHYLKLLALSNQHDLMLFRVISLWFDNMASEDLSAIVKNQLDRVPCYKWLPAWYQVVARISDDPKKCCTSFIPAMNKIVLDTCQLHPFHTFYTIFALTKGSITSTTEKSRVNAAQSCLKQLQRSSKAALFQELTELANAYLILGKQEASKPGEKVTFDRASLFAKRRCHNIPLPTISHAVSCNGDYRNLVRIERFESHYFVSTSGKSKPKILSCLCSDGVQRRQLVKAHDDLRQDAVMQQVFRLVNMLLSDRREASSDAVPVLCAMRSYQVLPLDPDVGIIEFCEGTVSLGSYLCGVKSKSKGAHATYNPNDWTIEQCKMAIYSAATDANASVSGKLTAYLKCVKHLRPVMRHFFYERYPNAKEFYRRRLAYIKSVATSAMVGHVLGLGDRHVENILIDEQSAELVHIDLGIAFEEGKILQTPEVVPFRLTRDIEDGLGVCGVEGAFRRSCEHVMAVLRESGGVLLPIVSVLLDDPLSDWTLDELKQSRIQPLPTVAVATAGKSTAKNGSGVAKVEEEKNALAERAIIKLKEKLVGKEGTDTFGVEGQVNHLINIARQPEMLAVMYCGWQGYL